MGRVKVRILGGGREVGRAAISVSGGGVNILLDYGVNFNERDEPQLPLHIRPSEVTLMAITHAHLDHIGAAPIMYTTARLPVIMTALTAELGSIMIKDFLKLSGYYLPFEEVDLQVMIDNSIHINHGQTVSFEGCSITFLNAGHIPGSSMILTEVDGVKVLYTGDVNTVDTRLVKGASLDGVEADVLIIEGTYGNSIHPSRKETEREFVDAVKDVIEAGGNVLIPAFSLGRSQEILALLYEKLPEADVYYDGMIRTINDVLISHPEHINEYGLLVKALSEFRAIRNSSERRKVVKGEGKVIVSSAGMLKGGPARYYVKKVSRNPKNAIFLVSFQAPGTPGREMLESGRLLGFSEPVQARLMWFDFSSHAGQDGLLRLAKQVKGLHKIVLVHSEEEAGKAFKEKLMELFGEDNVHFPTNGEAITIET